MGYDLGVDLGGTTVVAAVLRDGEARAVAVGLGPDGEVTVPAVAHRGTDGVVRTGVDAERRASDEPDRVVRDVTARLGDDVPLVVGDEPWRADDVAAEIVLTAVRRVAALEGGAARSLAVTHPAGWGPHRERTLRRALVRVGLGHATLVAESRAAVLAASTFGGLRPGRIAAVYDLGGRRFRAAVVRRGSRGVVTSGTGGAAVSTSTSAEVLADSGSPVRAGGTDVDAAVLAHVREELGEPFDAALAELDDDAARTALTALRRAAREAKERLSADTEADVPVEVGALVTVVRVTRADLEARITPLVAATVDAFASTLDAAGVAADLIVLVGGSARVPLVARLLAEELGRPVHPELDPVTVVAQGAALAAAEHAVSRRQEAPGVPAGAFPTHAAPAGAFPTNAAPAGAIPTTAVPAFSSPERHSAAGAAVAAGVALGASAARRPARAEEPDDRWGPAPDTGPTAVAGREVATREEGGSRPRAGRGTTALMERPHTPSGDVPRPPVGTATAPVGPEAPHNALRRYRPWLLAALAIVVLAAAAAMVPIPGLTSARTAQPMPPATSAPAVPAPTPGAAAPPTLGTPAPEPDADTTGEGSSTTRASSAEPTSSTRSSRTPNAFAPAAVTRPAAQRPVRQPVAQQPAAPQPAAPVVRDPAPNSTGGSPAVEAPAVADPPGRARPRVVGQPGPDDHRNGLVTPEHDDIADAAARAALAGDLDTALRLADAALRGPEGTDRLRGATVLAAVLPQRGLLARAAEVHRWLARQDGGGPDATVALLGTGALDEARAAAVPATGGLPGLRDSAAALVAQGLLASVDGSAGTALSLLVRATTALAAAGEQEPAGDSPAALGALLALHRGEPELADPLLDLAVDADLGGPALRRRHLLLRAFSAMMRDDEAAARAALAAARELPGPLEPRDELVTVAGEVALARRAGDTRGLLELWARARQALLRHPVDLYCLLPVGELAIAAARLGEGRWVEPHLAEATALLASLGDPASWGTSWHWAGLHAAITAEDPDAAASHATALDAAAAVIDRAVAPAHAARVWLAVLDGRIDADEVVDAATALRAVGLAWDGARLAGEAAIRTTDRTDSATLLACARALQAARAPVVPSAVPAPASSAPARAAATVRARREDSSSGLTDREREIAALVLEGLTYREIASRLFLSAKTVEHHVSRIRRRLGSESRAELFSELKVLVACDH